jgi:hypothetical protein
VNRYVLIYVTLATSLYDNDGRFKMLQKIPEKQGVPIAELPVQEEPINLFGVLQGELNNRRGYCGISG